MYNKAAMAALTADGWDRCAALLDK
eukprot:SAG31_NODE_43947_length_265_cov_0.608434_1_plen_24_part_01